MMNSGHPGLGPLGPIGVVTAPGPGGPVGIGIGVPIMTTSGMVSQMHSHLQNSHQNTLVVPDSSDEKDKCMGQRFSQRSSPPGVMSVPTSSANNNPATWANPLLHSVAGMGFPVMGMGVMGHSGTSFSDANMLYGLLGSHNHPNGNDMTMPHPSLNLNQQCPPNHQMNIPVSVSPPTAIRVDSGSNSGEGQSNQNASSQPMKQIIHCKSCTLFPPNPTAPPPTTREKPPGCRTVFVGGLPENVTEEIIREIFERCGEITTIRLSKKNFCHIRFELEHCIEGAIFLSGYRVRIGSNSDPPNVGRLHVDYAQARDDLYEWECRQRQQMREQRHRERIEQERLLPPSPPSIAQYSDHEASTVAEKIKSDDSFIKAIHILAAWLERGDCIKRNANSFYSMIQSTNSHVRRLLNEKSQYEEELQRAKELMRQRVTGLLMQFSQIEKVFLSACHRKVWDHFTKAQRKNLEMWKKQATEIKTILLEEALAERHDEEMDMSGSDSEDEGCNDIENSKKSHDYDIEPLPPSKKARLEDDRKRAVSQLKEENDSLRCQLEAANNEVDMIKADLRTELEQKDNQIKNMEQKIEELSDKGSEIQGTNDEKRGEKSCTSTTSPLSYNNELSGIYPYSCEVNCDSSVATVQTAANNFCTPMGDLGSLRTISTTELTGIIDKEAKFIGIISTFLHVHPFGASLDYIGSYSQKVLPSVRPNELETLLKKFPSLFREELSGVGASLERKWVFVGFD